MQSNLDESEKRLANYLKILKNPRKRSMRWGNEMREEKPHYGYYALPIFAAFAGAIIVAGLLVSIFLWRMVGAFLVAFGLYMVVGYAISARSFKTNKPVRLPESLKLLLQLRGDEEVLDVGCGLGRTTISVAKELTTGKVMGTDIWDKIEIPGNSPQRAYRNAQLEGVQEKVKFRTADVRELPFPDNSFDLVTASSVINNLKGEPDRLKALNEIYRVLRPGGRFFLLEPLLDLRTLLLYTPLAVFAFSSKEVWLDLLGKTEFVNLKNASRPGIGLFLVEKPA